MIPDATVRITEHTRDCPFATHGAVCTCGALDAALWDDDRVDAIHDAHVVEEDDDA
jgi:hypothetical protein